MDAPSDHTAKVRDRLSKIKLTGLRRRSKAAENELYNLGITFTVYSEKDSIDRVFPFDVIPRVLSPQDWQILETGVKQRVAALNAFLHDIYHKQHILNDGTVPAELILENKNYQPVMQGFDVPRGTYVHICGIDIVRDHEGRLLVLEDNARTPSGVSYVVENRYLMQRAFPDLMSKIGIRSISNYGPKLHGALKEVSPGGDPDAQVVLLTPGVFNSAYFEHIFLAREMGVPLVSGNDIFVGDDDRVYMKTTAGPERVHVIYRRIDDAFLDPEVFLPTSLLGVPGLMRAYRKGTVTLANAVGTGVADDKAVYAYMPRIIKYYLDQDPILDNVQTHICREEDGLNYTLNNLSDLVIKPVGESGGYGITIGPHASEEELLACHDKLRADPKNFISQPMIDLSVCPTLVDTGIEPRHVDLRPFAVTGKDTWVLPGGLTRVALRKGSIVVNSSQGGGSKDTWVLG
ncbi:MAG: circularly permuted type 2 ATP-grasp protein [Rhodospirillales bacterium]